VVNLQTGIFHPENHHDPRCDITEIKKKNRARYSSGHEAKASGHRPYKFDYPQKKEMNSEYPE